jgi:LPXTG-site transpeptidase (sortase) family protein
VATNDTTATDCTEQAPVVFTQHCPITTPPPDATTFISCEYADHCHRYRRDALSPFAICYDSNPRIPYAITTDNYATDSHNQHSHTDTKLPSNAGVLVPTDDLATPINAQPITHISIPAINLDSVVVDVGWEEIRDTTGQSTLVWQVAQYAVGHHYTSANPGQPDNIVLSGHVGGYGKVFRNLDQLKANDHIILTSGNQLFTYVVQQQIIVEELHASPSEQIANLSYIDTTPSETLTLITCWPPTGVDRFSKRLIIRALPLHNGNHK